MFLHLRLLALCAYFVASTRSQTTSGTSKCTSVLTGKAAFGDWRNDSPGVCRKITAADLPTPFDSPSATEFPTVIPQPAGAFPKVPSGFKVDQFFTNLTNGRLIRIAPNGDIFISEASANRVRVLRAADGATSPSSNSIFVTGLNSPFGINFYPPGNNPQWIYIANTNSVVRFPYQNGDMTASGASQTIIPSLPTGGHVTRDVVFSPDGFKMYISVGSNSNVWEGQLTNETNRANVLEYNPDGTGFRIFGSGIRNPVSIAINPTTNQLWVSINERDGLGDNLVPDYITHVQDGGFYGWPWYYIGGNPDPRHVNDSHPELKSTVIVPDVLLQPHSASLQMTFYTGSMFPQEYTGDAFASEHGSWNRGNRTGYKLIRVPMVNGVATGEYQDFMTGFVTDSNDVWGRPVGVAVAHDGALLVADDGSNSIWRISYIGQNAASVVSATVASNSVGTSATVASGSSGTGSSSSTSGSGTGTQAPLANPVTGSSYQG